MKKIIQETNGEKIRGIIPEKREQPEFPIIPKTLPVTLILTD